MARVHVKRPFTALIAAGVVLLLAVIGLVTAGRNQHLSDSNAPQQITIAYAGKGSTGMAISWETSGEAASVVLYGKSAKSLSNKAVGNSTTYTMYSYTSNHIHHVVLPNLGHSQQWFYQCGDPTAGEMSSVYNFTTAPAPGHDVPFHLAIVGDLGQTMYSAQTLGHVLAMEDIQAVMLAGDLSYADLDEQRWDSWGVLVQHATASLPWMFAAGNHEIEDASGQCPTIACGPLTAQCYADQRDDGCHQVASTCQAQCSDWQCRASCLKANAHGDKVTIQLAACITAALPQCESTKQPVPPQFLSYDTRFRMPWKETGGTSNQWYSWEAGPMHVTVLNSYAPFTHGTPQYNWLQSDLTSIDRSNTPWLIVVFHCPWYNSDYAHHGEGDAMKAALEPLLYSAQVAMVFSGHVHAMERTYPVYNNTLNANAPVYLVLGDGGNREGLATKYYEPQPVWSAFRQAEYGHGELVVKNATHAHFEWHRDLDKESTVTDEAWILNPFKTMKL